MGILHHDPQNLFNRRYTPSRFHKSVIPQTHHSLVFTGTFDLGNRTTSQDHFSDIVADNHQLVEANAPSVTAAAAPLAADRLVKSRFALSVMLEGEVQSAEYLLVHSRWALAVLAEPPGEPLGDHAIYCGRCKERLHPHLGEPGDGRGSIVGV